MSKALHETAAALRQQSVVDQASRFDAGARQEITQAIERAAKRDLRALVLVLPADQNLSDYHALWDMLKLKTSSDLLLLYNGPRWEAKGWALPQQTITRLLDKAEAKLPSHRAFTILIDRLADQARPLPEKPWLPAPLLPGLGAVVVGGGIVWVIRRRSILAKKRQATYREAKQSAEEVYGDVMLAAEDLLLESAADLQLRAADLKQQLDSLVSEVNGQTHLMGKKTTLGKFLHIENELTAIRSTILQKARKNKCSNPTSP